LLAPVSSSAVLSHLYSALCAWLKADRNRTDRGIRQPEKKSASPATPTAAPAAAATGAAPAAPPTRSAAASAAPSPEHRRAVELRQVYPGHRLWPQPRRQVRQMVGQPHGHPAGGPTATEMGAEQRGDQARHAPRPGRRCRRAVCQVGSAKGVGKWLAAGTRTSPFAAPAGDSALHKPGGGLKCGNGGLGRRNRSGR
jgi:hypothetical protein